jgi:glycosyltransferase involved in cell wall biosynthesis
MIVFIRSNPAVSDPRVEKEVTSLTAHGFRVSILAWDREGKFNGFESSNNRFVYRLRLRAPYRTLTIFIYYPFFWLWVFFKLLKMRPRVIHACDIDTFFPALVYRLVNKKTKVVFDVFDTYSLLIREKSAILGKLVRLLELQAASRADAFITVSKERLSFFNDVALKLTEIIMNCPPDFGFSQFTTSETHSRAFRIVYCGNVAPYRGLIELAEAIKNIDDVELVVAGRILDTKIVDKLNIFSSVKYVGQLNFNDALILEKSADAIPLLYDLTMPLHKVATPNKLFEAMMLGIPIITNLSFVLSDVCCGLNVNYDDVTGIKQAIIHLKENPELKHQLGANGRLGFEHKYNWSIMEKKLLGLYRKLVTAQLVSS